MADTEPRPDGAETGVDFGSDAETVAPEPEDLDEELFGPSATVLKDAPPACVTLRSG